MATKYVIETVDDTAGVNVSQKTLMDGAEFLEEAGAFQPPDVTVSDAGKPVVVNEGGTGFAVGAFPVVPDAAANVKGIVKQAANVAKAAGDAPTKAEFDALIDALVAAGIMAAAAAS